MYTLNKLVWGFANPAVIGLCALVIGMVCASRFRLVSRIVLAFAALWLWFFMTPIARKCSACRLNAISLRTAKCRGLPISPGPMRSSYTAARWAAVPISVNMPERGLQEFGFTRTDLGEVMLSLVENDGSRMPIWLLSEGTQRILLIAAALMSAPEGSLLVMEEIDTGIHSSGVAHVVQEFYRVAKERKIQILATTHNTEMLNAIPKNEVGNIVICYRDRGNQSSKLMRFGDMPEFVELMMRGKLGDLMVSEEIGKCLSEPYSDEKNRIG